MVCKLARQRKEGPINCAVLLLHSAPSENPPDIRGTKIFIPDVDGGEDVCCIKCFLVMPCFCRRQKKTQHGTLKPWKFGEIDSETLETDQFFQGLCPFVFRGDTVPFTKATNNSRTSKNTR